MSDPFFKSYSNQLPIDFCNRLINKFEQSSHKQPGKVLQGPPEHAINCLNLDLKTSMDLCISSFEEFKTEDSFLKHHLDLVMERYFSDLVGNTPPYFSNLTDTGFRVQRTCPGEKFNWHSDENFCFSNFRRLAYIFYLNNVADGGETEFVTGQKIKPEAGKCIVFPATWTYKHRGVSPKSNVKYICTGFVVEVLKG